MTTQPVTQTVTLPFTKMQGAGNDVIVLNAMQGLPALEPKHFRHLGDRRYGVGCDQILIVAPPQHPEHDFSYRIVNQDGSEVEHCGNGARCFMRYVRDQGLTEKTTVHVEMARGTISLTETADGQVQVNMGVPRFEPESLPFAPAAWPATAQANGFVSYQILLENGATPTLGMISMGNPHAVQRVADVATADLASTGPLIENHPAFANRVNAGFMQVVDAHHIKLRVWERGVGETLACGTGACAAVVAGVQWGVLSSPVQVQAPGGILNIEWSGVGGDVLMRGPAVTVYHGAIELQVAT